MCSLCRRGKSLVDRGTGLAKVDVAVSRLSYNPSSASGGKLPRRLAAPGCSSPTAFSEAAAEVGGRNFPFLAMMEILITTKTSLSEPAL